MDKQTAKFGARVLENLPEDMDSNLMQSWIENPKGMQKVLKEAFCPPEKKRIVWSLKNNVISFSLPVTNFTTGAYWVHVMERKGKRIDAYIKEWILSSEFKPTTGKIYNVKILKGELFINTDRTDIGIRQEAERRKLVTPSVEMACLIRDNFTDEEIEKMGINRLNIMHEPIKDSGGDMATLYINPRSRLEWLYSGLIYSGHWHSRSTGFAFEAS